MTTQQTIFYLIGVIVVGTFVFGIIALILIYIKELIFDSKNKVDAYEEKLERLFSILGDEELVSFSRDGRIKVSLIESDIKKIRIGEFK